MRVLLDTNVILDVLFMRPVTGEKSCAVFGCVRDHHDQICVSAMSFRDVEYIVRKKEPNPLTRLRIMQRVHGWIWKIIDLTADDVINAMYEDRPDYEDSLMIESAERSSLDAIITNNKRDFVNCHIAIFTPEEFVAISR